MPGQAAVTINGNQWTVSLATTYAELTIGLRGVASLAANTGMLFILPTAQAVSVDTTGMNFSLDIIFVSNNTVVDVARNIEPGYLVTEETPCDSFLEVNAGEAADVEVGDTVSTTAIQEPGFDWSTITSFAIPLALLGFVCAMAGGMMTGVMGSSSPPKLLLNSSKPKPTEKVTVKCPICEKEIEVVGRVTRSEALEKHIEEKHSRGGEHETCYEDAWRFLLKEQEGELIHGSVLTIGKRINHAWVELPTSFIWEPESGEFMKKSYFYERAEPRVQDRYTTEEAAIMAARTGNLGPWTEEERRQILSGEHHSMWLTLEQRKELEKKYGAVALRWAEEATRPGDLKGVETAAEYYSKKMREIFGLGHLSPELSEEQLKKLRELLGLDAAEVLKIHQETGYIPC